MTAILIRREHDLFGMSSSAKCSERALKESINRLRNTESVGLGGAIFHELRDVFDECCVADWDGYGALPVDQDTYINAIKFLNALPNGIPAPSSIDAEPDGELELEWYRSNSHLLSISISPKSRLNYAAAFGNERHNGTALFSTHISETILNLIRRAST